MNCLEFRRGILANPRQLDEAARAHALECADCREFLDTQRELDADLFAAMQVAPPDGLPDRILVARGLRPGRRRWLWGMAATVLLAAGITAPWRRLLSSDPQGREAIAHVAQEPQSFSTVAAVPVDFLPAVLSEQGVKLSRAVGQVTYERICPFAGRVARHLVVRTSEGPVTLFLARDDPRPRQRAVTQRDGMAAVVIPAAKGTITIVASSLDNALAVERSLLLG